MSDHINVTSIAPGAFASDMNRAARDHGDAVGSGIPSGRIGVAEDMAGAAIYLASRAGDYVVGDTITVDGGLVNASLGSSIDACTKPGDDTDELQTARYIPGIMKPAQQTFR